MTSNFFMFKLLYTNDNALLQESWLRFLVLLYLFFGNKIIILSTTKVDTKQFIC